MNSNAPRYVPIIFLCTIDTIIEVKDYRAKHVPRFRQREKYATNSRMAARSPPVQLSNKLTNTSLDVSLPAPGLVGTALDSGEWVRLFARMAKLESLWVCGSTAHRLPRALTRLGWHEELGDGGGFYGPVESGHTAHFDAATPPHGAQGSRDALKLRLCSCRNVLAEEIQDFDVLELDAEYFGELKIDVDLSELDSSDSEEDYEDYYDDANDTVEWPLGRKP
ncbi:hypothetical protein A0H81_08185 [Grifola frondosa]|uniref:Uncharacterized protein n=1 Tax=Grifola frondosa TaxID=5627 RepID=A0A1C7M4H3_GRIFR|nr:hypothetical protein A0H81_08185 [Grifola frondosa]